MQTTDTAGRRFPPRPFRRRNGRWPCPGETAHANHQPQSTQTCSAAPPSSTSTPVLERDTHRQTAPPDVLPGDVMLRGAELGIVASPRTDVASRCPGRRAAPHTHTSRADLAAARGGESVGEGHSASSRASSPDLSSLTRSSAPPMCRSPMTICGKVSAPKRSRSSARMRATSTVARISWIVAP